MAGPQGKITIGRIPLRVYLIGFMGAGKSTIGRQAARDLGFGFLDLDTVIETAANATIRKLIETEGEGVFREKERKALHQTLDTPISHLIVATGGGVPCFFDNLDWINAHGVSLFLDPGWDTIRQRLEPHRQHRPMLQGDDQTWSDRAKALYEARLPIYQAATLHLEGSSASTSGLITCLQNLMES